MRATELRRSVRRLPILFLLAVLGCGQADEADHGHAHDEVILRLTGWSAGAEAFVEHPPLWAGRDAGFMIHVTDLNDGSPRGEGAVVLRGVGADGAVVEAVAARPMRPGVYAVALGLPESGSWRLELGVDGETVALGPVAAHPDRETALHADVATLPSGITFLKEQQWRLGVVSVDVERSVFVHAVRVAATVTSPPDRRAVVSTPLEGRLETAPGRALPLPGDTVKAGETLAVVQPPFSGAVADAAAAEAALVTARTAAELAESERSLVRALAADGAASERRLQEAEAAAERAAADLDAAERVRAAYVAAGLDVAADGGAVRLASPIDGIVTRVHVSLGEQLGAGTPFVTVLDPTVVWLEGRVPEADMLLLGDEPEAAYRLPGSPGRPRELDGDALVYLSHEVDTSTRTAPIIFRYENATGLRVGMAVELVVKTRREENALVIPHEAIVDEDGETVVFVQLDGETFEKRHVVVGGDDGRSAVIRSGLVAGERVVATSPYSILLAQAGTAVPAHGHTH